MTTAAEKRALVGASKRIALVDPPPPGERPEDELTGTAALDALHDALLDITGQPRASFSLLDIKARKVSGWIVLTFYWKGRPETEATVRLAKDKAALLYERLGKVLS